MKSRWSDGQAAQFAAKYAGKWGEDLAFRTYLATLIGSEENLVLHGGGNSSVKTISTNVLGEEIPTIFVKASGLNMAAIEPQGYTGLDLEHLKKLRKLPQLSDEEMANELRTHFLDCRSAPPSIETLVHAFIPKKFMDHTHADAILTLTNQSDGERLVREALGPDVLILEYIKPGFMLARAAAAAFEASPNSKAMVWMRHGVLSWGDRARESYETMVATITSAEEYLAKRARPRPASKTSTSLTLAAERYIQAAPVIRGLLAQPTDDSDHPYSPTILQPLITRETLDFVDSDQGRAIALSPPLTSDHIIRTRALPLWVDTPRYDDIGMLREQVAGALRDYSSAYAAYIERNMERMPEGMERLDDRPRVILMPGLGAICSGKDVHAARIASDITAHTLAVKSQIADMGSYVGMAESDLFDMEYRGLQLAKLGRNEEPPLSRHVALVTGAAGAIGSGIAQELLEQGCHVAVTDLPGENLESLTSELKAMWGEQVTGLTLDVTDPGSIAEAFNSVIRAWGGIDLVVINAGTALVSSLAEMDLDSFRRLERVNVEGTLLVLSEAARRLKLQGIGGDIVLISTKNVFAPGAKFGAYSATKTAAHQLARIASLEFAEFGVRVNMVAPDAVFSNGNRRSGLWAEVGPDRMSARGLDARGLEDYYRNRNILKARVTARHVAKAVLFFATRQTPTTGATLPVDGGLPDATPR
jgi:rhamnose utilization protein RhaD (predicted bifunctional aldolase and dehydrogenase)/NAD(P)-dependent dehydrogenase (short-subunit alcohol dehydrogenase family)